MPTTDPVGVGMKAPQYRLFELKFFVIFAKFVYFLQFVPIFWYNEFYFLSIVLSVLNFHLNLCP